MLAANLENRPERLSDQVPVRINECFEWVDRVRSMLPPGWKFYERACQMPGCGCGEISPIMVITDDPFTITEMRAIVLLNGGMMRLVQFVEADGYDAFLEKIVAIVAPQRVD